MLNEAAKNPTKTRREIYENELINWNSDDENYPNFVQVRSALYRARKKVMPPIPKTIQEIRFSGEWDNTKTGKVFLFLQEEDPGLVAFSTRFFMENLSDCDAIIADGTFRSAPTPFAQLYVIFGIFDGCKIALLFAFLTGKTSNHYVCLLSAIKERCKKIGKAFNPCFVLSDYEKGFISAVSQCLPSATHYGCYFHFTQAVYRRVQLYGLSRVYRFKENVRFLIRQLFCLPYLPKSLVVETFEKLIASNEIVKMKLKYPKLQDLIDYVKRVWVNGFYPIAIRNIFERDCDLRASNIAESWNSKYNRPIGRTHPNF